MLSPAEQREWKAKIEKLDLSRTEARTYMVGWPEWAKVDRRNYRAKRNARKKAAENKKLRDNLTAEVEIKVLREASLCQIVSSTQHE